jgi:phosphoenolpyruvate---glycerone phosphotransferase subunit DhaL
VLVDIPLTRRWLEAVATALAEQADYLTQLDSAIGDADHGVNMNRGFTAVTAALDGFAPASVGDLLVRTGTTLVSRVGGASGPLYGTAFRAIGKALPAAQVSPAELIEALQAGLDGLRKLGAAQPGDKTIVDAWEPALEAMRSALPGGDLAAVTAAGAAAAEEGMRATTAMQARKGRASYLGARSVGHQDPGATSTWLVFRELARVAGAPEPVVEPVTADPKGAPDASGSDPASGDGS